MADQAQSPQLHPPEHAFLPPSPQAAPATPTMKSELFMLLVSGGVGSALGLCTVRTFEWAGLPGSRPAFSPHAPPFTPAPPPPHHPKCSQPGPCYLESSPCIVGSCDGFNCIPTTEPIVSPITCTNAVAPATTNCAAEVPVETLQSGSPTIASGFKFDSPPSQAAAPAGPYSVLGSPHSVRVTLTANVRDVAEQQPVRTCNVSCSATVTVRDAEPLNPDGLSCGLPGDDSQATVAVVKPRKQSYAAAYTGTKTNGCPVTVAAQPAFA